MDISGVKEKEPFIKRILLAVNLTIIIMIVFIATFIAIVVLIITANTEGFFDK
ncbi:hypothetical protein bwei_2235 [Bacillus mycoides]|nr:hypothetical protein bwei_2235 [Bacillus mycoides]EEL05728.1 hypothetical protein bcere0014_26020 [Bacillus cereus BDRD-ST196]